MMIFENVGAVGDGDGVGEGEAVGVGVGVGEGEAVGVGVWPAAEEMLSNAAAAARKSERNDVRRTVAESGEVIELVN